MPAACHWPDVPLPAATWGEKEGRLTNSERRISRVRAAVPPSELRRMLVASPDPAEVAMRLAQPA